MASCVEHHLAADLSNQSPSITATFESHIKKRQKGEFKTGSFVNYLNNSLLIAFKVPQMSPNKFTSPFLRPGLHFNVQNKRNEETLFSQQFTFARVKSI